MPPAGYFTIEGDTEMEETNEVRLAPDKKQTEYEINIRCIKSRLEILRKKNKDLQKIKEKLTNTIY